jgi:hypothetical protein
MNKLGTSAETFLRYETAWKKDLYRAFETLRRLQESREAKGGGARPVADFPNKATAE